MKTGNFYYPIQQAIKDLNTQINYNDQRQMQMNRDLQTTKLQTAQMGNQIAQQHLAEQWRQAEFDWKRERAQVSDDQFKKKLRFDKARFYTQEHAMKEQVLSLRRG